LQQNGTIHVGALGAPLEFVFVALVDRDHRGTGFVRPVGKNKARGLTGLQPYPELQHLGLLIRHHRAAQERLDGLRIVDVPLGDITGNNAQNEGLRKIDPKDRRVIVRIAIHRLGLDLEIIKARDRHPLLKVFNVTIAALARIGVGLLVEVEIAIVEYPLVRAAQLFVLHEVAVEMPTLRLHHGLAQTGFHKPFRGLEILIDQKPGSHERLPDRIDMTAGFLLRKIRG
jgi:hypothetical protein